MRAGTCWGRASSARHFRTLGYNGHVAWSHTVNNPDIVDVYAITFDDKTDPLKYRYGDGSRQAMAWTEDVVMKDANGGRVSRRFRFTKTHQGPVVAVRDGKSLAIRLAKLEEGGSIDQSYAMGRAKSVADFKEAMRPCNLPMFNAIVADTGGNIFYVYNGAVPKRSTNFDWTKPVDGSNPDTEWQGYLRFEELPQLENPKCGFLQNCNQSPLSTTPVARELQAGETDENPKASAFPPYLMATERERDNPRSQISRRILHSTAKFDIRGLDSGRLRHQDPRSRASDSGPGEGMGSAVVNGAGTGGEAERAGGAAQGLGLHQHGRFRGDDSVFRSV